MSVIATIKNIPRKPVVVVTKKKKRVASLPMFFRLPLQEQMLFAKRLAILLKAGVPILESLKMMKKQMSSRSGVYVLNDLFNGVENGQSLHMGMEKYRKSFGDFAVNIIRIGEISGTLNETLGYLAEEIKKKRELRRKVISALVYPAFIVVATIGITVLLTVYIFPKILPILSGFKGQLPFTTRTLMFVSHAFITHGLLIVLSVVGLAVLGSLLMCLKSFRLLTDKLILKIPLLGKLFQYYHMANFCRTLGVLLRSNVQIIEATDITAKTSTNLVYQKSLYGLSQSITRGTKLSVYFEENTKIFPPMVSQMVMVGESTGKLSDSLLYLAEIYENEVSELTQNLSASIEPLLMIFMGLLVGFIAMSIITPIYSLTQNLSIH